MDNIKISKVELAIGKKKVSLTIEEAVELKQLLDRTFDKPQVTHIPYIYPYYSVTPWWTYFDTVQPSEVYGLGAVACGTDSGNWTVSSSGDVLMLNCS